MQIPQTLTQFSDTPTLLIVSGSQHAKFYYALNGAIEEITEFKVATPIYQDREGFFLRSGKGAIYGSGAVYESKQKSTDDMFIERLNELLDAIRKEIEIKEVILSAPDYEVNLIQNKLRSDLKDKVTSVLRGNYTKLHPTELLKKLE